MLRWSHRWSNKWCVGNYWGRLTSLLLFILLYICNPTCVCTYVNFLFVYCFLIFRIRGSISRFLYVPGSLLTLLWKVNYINSSTWELLMFVSLFISYIFSAIDIHKYIWLPTNYTFHLSTYTGDYPNIFRLFLVAIFREHWYTKDIYGVVS